MYAYSFVYVFVVGSALHIDRFSSHQLWCLRYVVAAYFLIRGRGRWQGVSICFGVSVV